MIAWKLFRQMKDGSIAPLFINKRMRLRDNVWYKAKCYPTKGFAVRKGFHVTAEPRAPHLTEKGRVWRKVLINGYTEFQRPESQGGLWYLADEMMVLPQE